MGLNSKKSNLLYRRETRGDVYHLRKHSIVLWVLLSFSYQFVARKYNPQFRGYLKSVSSNHSECGNCSDVGRFFKHEILQEGKWRYSNSELKTLTDVNVHWVFVVHDSLIMVCFLSLNLVHCISIDYISYKNPFLKTIGLQKKKKKHDPTKINFHFLAQDIASAVT